MELLFQTNSICTEQSELNTYNDQKSVRIKKDLRLDFEILDLFKAQPEEWFPSTPYFLPRKSHPHSWFKLPSTCWQVSKVIFSQDFSSDSLVYTPKLPLQSLHSGPQRPLNKCQHKFMVFLPKPPPHSIYPDAQAKAKPGWGLNAFNVLRAVPGTSQELSNVRCYFCWSLNSQCSSSLKSLSVFFWLESSSHHLTTPFPLKNSTHPSKLRGKGASSGKPSLPHPL